MTPAAGPRITGINHFSATVTDLEASVAWYQQLFGLDRVPFDFAHYEREETGYGVVLMDPSLGIAIGLHTNTANQGEAFDECRTGLDHVSFGVADRDEIDGGIFGGKPRAQAPDAPGADDGDPEGFSFDHPATPA